MFNYFTIDAGIAMFFAFIGCAIRYSELHKQNQANFSWFLIDGFIAVFLGYITWLELTVELEVSLVHTILVSMLVGNIGSKILTIAKLVLLSKLEKAISRISPGIEKYLTVENKDDGNNDNDTNSTHKE